MEHGTMRKDTQITLISYFTYSVLQHFIKKIEMKRNKEERDSKFCSFGI